MADTIEKVVKEAVENATETITGAKVPASPEGTAVAYGSLVIMAMLPIFFGALRSVKHQKEQKVRSTSEDCPIPGKVCVVATFLIRCI